MALMRMIGASVKRREDPRLVTGQGTYVDDVRPPGVLYMAVVRSPHAHARIERIDTSAALRCPGVVAAFTGADVDLNLPTNAPLNRETPPPPHPALARERVRHVGEAVAVVLAEDRYVARDAAELVEVTYTPLPAVTSPEAAIAPGAPLVHEAFPGNVYVRIPRRGGDIEAAFRQAARVIRLEVVNQRVNSVPMEPRAVVAEYQRGDGMLTVWCSHQAPHTLRSLLAALLQLPESRLRVIAPDVGGGFGAKLNLYPEEALVPWAALRLRRSVKWVEDRRESLLTLAQGRGQVNQLEAAVAADGRVLGLRARILADLGAYLQLATALIPFLTTNMIVGPYDIQNVDCELVEVFTHRTPTDAHRGAGRPEAIYQLERLMDRIAAELGLDPAEVRRRNFIPPDRFPYRSAVGTVYDSGNYAAALDKALAMVDYPALRAEQARLRAQGRYLGIGIASYVESTGVGPSRVFHGPGWESAAVRVEPDGSITLLTGSTSQGQGHETSFAQIVADELGVPFESVRVVSGDTAATYHGVGTFSSRSMPVAGAAVVQAAARVREKALQIAASLLEAAPEDIEYREGRAVVRGAPGKALTFQEIARAAYMAYQLPPHIEPGLEATVFFDPPSMTYPFGTHICVVEVDPTTGEVQILRFVAVDDCGRIINPLLAAGQLHGGIAQGIGQALYEESVYDAEGQLRSASLMEYAVPTATRLPRYELAHTETLSTTNPLGAKGLGEAGTIGSTPAVVNAVLDALAPFGVTHIDMPLKPERIWRAIAAARGASTA
jgi:carbon-monoxide dehydrogenase large subunit